MTTQTYKQQIEKLKNEIEKFKTFNYEFGDGFLEKSGLIGDFFG